jgi:hypothetical protein
VFSTNSLFNQQPKPSTDLSAEKAHHKKEDEGHGITNEDNEEEKKDSEE